MATKGWVEGRGSLVIITGPIFAVENDSVGYKVIGPNHVAVPTHFYKIIVDANDSHNVQALAFIMPNKDIRGHDYVEYLTSIDEIEKKTGLDFLSALPVEIQEKVEIKKADKIW